MKAALTPVLKPVYRGVAILVAHCALVLSVAGQYAWDRGHLPRAWANATPVDPESPIRGRYITMHLRVEPAGAVGPYESVRLSAENGRLVAHADPKGALRLWGHAPDRLTLSEPVAFFIPEHLADPSRRETGEELWVEVSVPPKGPPRPIRLAVKKDGVLKPIEIR